MGRARSDEEVLGQVVTRSLLQHHHVIHLAITEQSRLAQLVERVTSILTFLSSVQNDEVSRSSRLMGTFFHAHVTTTRLDCIIPRPCLRVQLRRDHTFLRRSYDVTTEQLN